MWFDVDPRSSVPLYQQVVDGVKEAVAKQILRPGDKLPSVRELAGQITINPNTIARAYQELERESVIETLRGRGTYIASRPSRPQTDEDLEKIAPQLEKLFIEAYYLNIPEENLLDFVRKKIKEWFGKRREENE